LQNVPPPWLEGRSEGCQPGFLHVVHVTGQHPVQVPDICSNVDPAIRQVAEAVCLEQLSYHEAWELSYFGANVLHPRTTLPAMKFRCANAALLSAPSHAHHTLAKQHFQHVLYGSKGTLRDMLARHVVAAEAQRATHFGASLLLCLSVGPAGCSIPITIRNFFELEAPGTVIGDFVTAEDGSGGQFVKGFATIDDVALINVEVTPGIPCLVQVVGCTSPSVRSAPSSA